MAVSNPIADSVVAGRTARKLDGTIVGSGDTPNPPEARVGFTVAHRIDNPDTNIMQNFVGYSFYTGTPAVGVGSLQGGSIESKAFASPADMNSAVLGFEGIGRGDSDLSRTIPSVIGIQSTASAHGTAVIPDLVSLRASGPHGSGTPNVTNAYSLQVQEPTVGTNRFAAHLTGRSRFKRGADTGDIMEVVDASDVRSFGFDGTYFRGYDTDGASVRLVVDPRGGQRRIVSESFGGTTTHFVARNDGADRLLIRGDGLIQWVAAGNEQTTVGLAGAASTLPTAPTKYLKIVDSAGTVLVVPAYNAA